GITQGMVAPRQGFGFAEGLRSILRQDPNIIMVGEIRDTETAEIALSASLTGHLLLTTLHTVSALGAVNRLIDMGLEPFLVASALTAVTAQRL
ncbi:ATPase, T2SS/T4P/T4SS family, partial [Acinetobacter baumannii]